jgi:hypothetical protein
VFAGFRFPREVPVSRAIARSGPELADAVTRVTRRLAPLMSPARLAADSG